MPFIVAVSGNEPELLHRFSAELSDYLRAHGGCRNSSVCPTSENCLNRTSRVVLLENSPDPDKAAHDIISRDEAEYVVAVVNTPDDIRADVSLSPEDNVPEAAEKLLNRYQKYNDEVALAKEYEQDGRVLILAPESLYCLNTLSKSFEGLERMYRAGYAAAEAIPAFLKS